MLPAVGQGIIAIQAKSHNYYLKKIIKKINHKKTFDEMVSERAMLKKIGGDCDTAVGGYAKTINGEILLKAELYSDNGLIKYTSKISGKIKSAKKIGLNAGVELLKKAGKNYTRNK